MKLDRACLRWHWRTWNLLHQVEQASDGKDSRYRAGEVNVRGIWIGGDMDNERRAMEKREWIRAFDSAEVVDGGERPVYEITENGRAALATAKAAGVQWT